MTSVWDAFIANIRRPLVKKIISLLFRVLFIAACMTHIAFEMEENIVVHRITKGLPLMMLSCRAFLVWPRKVESMIVYSVGAFLSGCGDILLDYSDYSSVYFVTGVLLFMIVHLLYSWQFTKPPTPQQRKANNNAPYYPLHPLRFIFSMILPMVTVVWVIANAQANIGPVIEGGMFVYGTILAIDLWRALARIGHEATQEEMIYSYTRAIGSFFFMVCDLLVIIEVYVWPPDKKKYLYITLMVCYYLGQYLILHATKEEQMYMDHKLGGGKEQQQKAIVAGTTTFQKKKKKRKRYSITVCNIVCPSILINDLKSHFSTSTRYSNNMRGVGEYAAPRDSSTKSNINAWKSSVER
eukprot:TRINITY_DN2217_c0_g2_i4.p1 TRINITY_DN2217_c0_g2~~TRINITY_DN2217_c0_g2_i4.p1  ORF type:complete len:353 (-),score=57.23 TRINITY_DN2217_c0_g2_i4:771-1829(-)